jgi:hypothetical protein
MRQILVKPGAGNLLVPMLFLGYAQYISYILDIAELWQLNYRNSEIRSQIKCGLVDPCQCIDERLQLCFHLFYCGLKMRFS